MKILIASDWYAPVINGVVTSVVNLERELRALGHEVRILTLADSRISRREGSVTYLGSLPAREIYPEARVALRIRDRLIRELIDWAPDVIHTQAEFSTFVVARRIASRLRVPLVHSYHTVYEDYTHYFSPSRRLGRAAVAVFTRESLRGVDRVIVPTRKIADLIAGYGVRNPVAVIPSGIDLSRFDAPRDEGVCAAMRSTLGLPHDAQVLVSVGRLAKEKNLEELIGFLAQLDRRDVHLLVVGDGPHRAALEEAAVTYGVQERVRFVGMVAPHEVALYYRLGDVFVSASNSETQGLSYIEALATGTPALCRDDACLEGVLSDGENGWRYRTFEEFERRLETMLPGSELHARMGATARELAVRDFSSRSFAVRVLEQYRDAIALRSSLTPRAPRRPVLIR